MIPSTFDFTIGGDVEDGPSQLYVVANGIASIPVDVTISGGYDNVAAELKAKQDADAKAPIPKIATSKKTTITCIKGKLTRQVTAIKPVCPSGYKKK